MENLATIQKIKSVRNCPDSDNLDLVQILGWQVVTKRNEFKVDDLVIYICIDTVVPDHPEFEFLRNKGFKIKQIKLRKQESAGIVFPLSLLTVFDYDLKNPLYEGLDVTDIIKVIHYEKPIPAELAGKAIGGLPGFIIMTDEKNLRSYPDAVAELYGRPYYISEKADGSSGTFFLKGGEFGVCSRKIHLLETEGNGFWKMVHKYDIQNSLLIEFPGVDIALQAECVGPGIQKNKLGLTEMEIRAFNLFDITKRYYLTYDEVTNFCIKYKLPMVRVIETGTSFGYNLEELLQLSNKQKYSNENFAEGIVIRPKESFFSKVLNKSWSGKVMSENYEEKK